jgi:sulfur carrier protein ThiS
MAWVLTLLLSAITCMQSAAQHRVLGTPEQHPAPAGAKGYSVLEPITSGNLTIYPVAAATSYDTSQFITLDEGIRAGSVVVTEQGSATGMVRPGSRLPLNGAEVNRLALYNKSGRPLLLLAGEIVTGGKQDRVIAADRIVPAGSEAVDLGVFCVEPGRWTGSSAGFGSMKAQMAQPSVRRPAMAARDQQMVWNEVRESAKVMSHRVPMAASPALSGTTSYAKVMDNPAVQKQVDEVAAPIVQNYEAVLRQLKQKKAVGVVVAVNGDVMWADIFASTALLEQYWPKLVRSYAAEAVTASNSGSAKASAKDALQFVNQLGGGKEVSETNPGIFRRVEISGDGYEVFTLTSLLAKTNFDVHITKMKQQHRTAHLAPPEGLRPPPPRAQRWVE